MHHKSTENGQTAWHGFLHPACGPWICAILALALLMWSVRPANAQNPSSIRIGVASVGVGNPPRITMGTMAIVQSLRFIEDEFKNVGIKIEWIFFKGEGPAVNEAISNNQIDFATQGSLPAIVGRSVGLDTRVVFVTSSRSNTFLLVPPNSSIKSVADLRGKRVAFHKGTASQLAVNRILAMHGLNEKDIRVLNLDPAAAQAALQAGDLDAIFGTITSLRLRDTGVAKVIYTTRDVPEATASAQVAVNQAFARKYPELTRRFVKALVKGSYWISNEKNREPTYKIWSQSGSVTEAMYREEYSGVPLVQRLSPLFDPFIVARIKQAVDDAYRFRLIRKKFDVDTWIDRSYLDAALKELKLENHWTRFDATGKSLDAG